MQVQASKAADVPAVWADVWPGWARFSSPQGAQLSAVTSLCFTGSSINMPCGELTDHEIAKALAPVLCGLTRLAVLRLTSNKFGRTGLVALAPALHHLKCLRELDLCRTDRALGNEDGAGGAQALAPALQHLTGLSRLGLNGGDFCDEGIHALAPMLQRLTGLVILSLSGNDFGAAGAQALAPAL